LRQELRIDRIMADLTPLLDGMTEGAERTRDIVDGLKRFSAIDRSADESFNLSEVVARAVRWVVRAGPRNFHVNVDLPPELPVIGSSGQMQQVLMNLVQNARDATVGANRRRSTSVLKFARGRSSCASPTTGPESRRPTWRVCSTRSSQPNRLGRGPGSGCRSATALSNGTAVAWKRRTGPRAVPSLP
jgi:two-component system sensor histidine kinase HupT/HoxJ